MYCLNIQSAHSPPPKKKEKWSKDLQSALSLPSKNKIGASHHIPWNPGTPISFFYGEGRKVRPWLTWLPPCWFNLPPACVPSPYFTNSAFFWTGKMGEVFQQKKRGTRLLQNVGESQGLLSYGFNTASIFIQITQAGALFFGGWVVCLAENCVVLNPWMEPKHIPSPILAAKFPSCWQFPTKIPQNWMVKR